MTTPHKAQFKRSLARSTWVTGSWNWLLTLVSRAAEAILTVTILYATLQIFTETNPQVDLGMFLAQQIALDAGGIGLIKMANQARRDGQMESAHKARTVALILMVLMGIGVVIAEVESKITTTTTLLVGQRLVTTTLDFKHAYPEAAIVIEVLLLIARGAMAIVYGFTIHDLESAQPEEQAPASPPADEVQALVKSVVTEAVATLERAQTQRIHELSTQIEHVVQLQQTEQQRVCTIIQEVQDTQRTFQVAGPAPSQDAVVNAVMARLHTLFAEQQAAKNTRKLAAPAHAVVDGASSAHTPQPRVPTSVGHTSQAEIAKRSRRIDPAEVDAVVHPLLDRDHSLTHRKIAAMPGIVYTETVVYTSVKRWRNTQPVVESTPFGEEPDTHSGTS
jgi:HAMP domain-containing protein